jgi:hypothetical protein
MDDGPEQEATEEFKRRRRRERWSAFLTPFITLASVVVSIGLLMFFMKACQERFPQSPFPRQGSPSRPASQPGVPSP